jgi:hypothetical protein
VAELETLRLRAESIVDRLLAENEPHWRSLCEADRQTVETLTRTVASRLLDFPAQRLAADGDDAVRAAHVSALCRLFALDDQATRRSAAFESRSE